MHRASLLIIAAIFAVALLELYAIHRGIDGTALAVAVGVIGALAGAKVSSIFSGK